LSPRLIWHSKSPLVSGYLGLLFTTLTVKSIFDVLLSDRFACMADHQLDHWPYITYEPLFNVVAATTLEALSIRETVSSYAS
jgi:hypothetical protein